MNITRIELLIVSLTPQNIERGDLWFAENLGAIKKAVYANPWWQDNALFLEKDLEIKPSLLVRRLMDMGYERAGLAAGKGLFAVQGGIVEIWPVNEPHAYAIEFAGNVIATIIPRERPSTETKPRYRGLVSVEKVAEGNFVVHTDHGIGVYRGTTQTNAEEGGRRTSASGQRESAYFVVEYAAPGPGREPDILFVPTDQKDRITPYVGFTTPVIHRLGGALWSRTKRKVREDAEKLAHSLFTLYQNRHRAMRPAYAHGPSFLAQLHETFEYEETQDQLRAEEDIMADLSRARPMDRILCGDVGFGKTEIAIRAAAAVIAGGKQVAVLAPTTVLAAQHERTFRERLEKLAINVAMLSRLTAPKDEKKILSHLSQGKIDCIIGTSRLLSSDIAFNDLGMIIIDEEQRFGVSQKERCKELRAHIDVLSLSATPIPRTLSLALAKLRDISRLDTPPPRRLAIATAVLPFGKKIIRDAITYEIARGGQIYFLHNRIETIGIIKEKLIRLLAAKRPKSDQSTNVHDRKNSLTGAESHRAPRIGVIHGRMQEPQLLKIMEAFRNRDIDILMATTIIENGLDISSANTLIVDDATRLGLAQAHQLRGRIGRGSIQAFAYFLYKPQRLTERGANRLEALKEYAELGAGYEIALRDLEIRGAGNVFGREQSGAINKVGLNLYCQMIAEATEEAGIEK